MFKFNESSAMNEGGTTGSKVLDTGVYDVTIVTASKVIASTGTVGIDWSLQVEGAKYPNMVYGLWVQKANGDTIFGMDILQSLMGIVGVKQLTEFQKAIDVKGGTKKVTAFKELEGVKVKVAVQKVFDVYNDKVSEKNDIKAFFDKDGRTYSERIKNVEPKQIKYYQEKMVDAETPAYKAYTLDADEAADAAADAAASEDSGGSLL